MPKLVAISTVLILGAGMCGKEQPDASRGATTGATVGTTNQAVEQPYIQRKNENLRELKQDLQNTHDEHQNQLDQKIKTGSP